MKPFLCLIAAVLCCLPSTHAQPSATLSVSNQLLTAGYRMTSVDADTRTWTGSTLRSNELGSVSAVPHQVIELGLFNRWDENRGWIESTPALEVTDAGVIGRGARHEIFLSANLNTPGAVSVRLPSTGSAQYLRTHILALAYAFGGTNYLLAQVKDSTAQVHGSRVLFPDAFEGADADVLYSYTSDGLMQFVILRAQPPTPQSLGLPSEGVRLVVISEIVEGPEPRVTGGSALDPQLEFGGAMSMTHGRAFLLQDQDSPRVWRAPHVFKRYETTRQRRFLYEALELGSIHEFLLTLPPGATNAGLKSASRFFADATLLPAPPVAKSSSPIIRHAALPIERPGFVLDWELVHTIASEFTFASADSTTYILRHPVHLSARTRFQRGAVVLLQEGPLHIDGTLEFAAPQAGTGAKVIFTTLNDPAAAAMLAQQDLPAEPALGAALVVPPLYYAATARNVEARYAAPGIVLNQPTQLPTVQLALRRPEISPRESGQLTFQIIRRADDLTQPLTVRFRAKVGSVTGADARGVISSSASILPNQDRVEVTVPINQDRAFTEAIVLKLLPDDDGTYLVDENGTVSLPWTSEDSRNKSSIPPHEGIVAWWKAENDALDGSGNAHHATALNQVGFVSGKVNEAFGFNGTSSYVEVPRIPGLNDRLTIEFWVKRQRSSAPEYVVEQGGDWSESGEQNFAVQLHANGKLCFTWAGGYRMGGNIPVSPNWYHCAVVARNGEPDPVLYINGQRQTISETTFGSIVLHATSLPLHIGAQRGSWDYYSQTLIDELTIYNVCLTDTDILAIYNAGPDGKILCGNPAITTQPQHQIANLGGNAAFTVTASGTPPLGYQWYKNDDNHPVGGNSSALTLTTVQASDAGAYYVKVSDCGGTVISSAAMLTVSPNPPPCAPLPANLLGWWRAEGNANNTLQNYNGTFDIPAYSAWQMGQAFEFNGSSSYVTVDDFPDLTSELTIEFWVKRERLTGAYEFLVEKGGDWTYDEQNFGIQLHGPDNDLVFSWAHCYRGAGAGVIADYNWHHCAVVAVNDEPNPLIYIDGVFRPITVTEGSSNPISFPSSNRPLHIGAQLEWNYYGQTRIDDLCIYNTALSEGQIQAIFNAGAAGKCEPALPPTITAHPQSQTVGPGANVTFTVAATGTAPLAYRWFHAGAEIPGATTATLSLSAVGPGDGGEYKAIVSNPYGQAASSTATLTVQQVATPTFSPIPRVYPFIQDVTISCATDGAEIHYTLTGAEPELTSSSFSAPILVDHDLTLKAKAWKQGWAPSETASGSYVIEAGTDLHPPAVTLSPPTCAFLASEDIEILVEASDEDGTVTLIELLRDGTKVAGTTTSPLRYTLPKAFAGTYTFTARAQDNCGLSTVTAPVVYTVNASGPVVHLYGERPLWTSSPATLFASVYGINPGTLKTLTLNGWAVPLTTGDFTLLAALAEGPNTFTLIATDTQDRSHQAAATVTLDSGPPSIAITAPANGSSFGTTRINVSGTFTESALKRITVNGVRAFVTGTSWEAFNVPLIEGANTITATAEDLAGSTQTATIMVTGTANPVDPVQLQATPVGGFASLNVMFTVLNNAPGTFQHVNYDFIGDNSALQTAADLNPVSHIYAAGQYFPVVTIQTSSGRFSSLGGWNGGYGERLRINVQAPPQQVGNAISVSDPVDLKWVEGNLYVLSRQGATVREFDPSGTVVRNISDLGGDSSAPTGLDVDSAGNVYVALNNTHRVVKLLPSGASFAVDSSFGTAGYLGSQTPGSGNGEFNLPFDVAVSPDGKEIAVSDSNNHRIQRFTKTGAFFDAFGESGTTVGRFNGPKGLTYDTAGYLYIVDSGNNRVCVSRPPLVIGASGGQGAALGQFQGAVNLSVGDRGIYVADAGNDRVQSFDPIPTGCGDHPETPFSPRGLLSSEVSLSEPNSAAAVADLLEEKLYIADTANNRVILVRLPGDGPLGAWNNMVAEVAAGDIPGAISSFCSATAEDYRQALLTVGISDSISDINQIGPLTPVYIRNDTAQYYFEQSIDGFLLLFPVQFVRENGVWKILGF